MSPDDLDLTAELESAEDIVMGRAEAVVTDDAPPIRLSAVFQMGPLWRPGQPGAAYGGDLQRFAEDMTSYLATQLERFGDQRGADLFLAIMVDRGEEQAGHEYRSGHYVKDEPGPAPENDPAAAAAPREDEGP